MDRLTHMSDGYFSVDSADCWEDQNEEYCGPAIDRLAAYENAGLEPGEVEALLMVNEAMNRQGVGNLASKDLYDILTARAEGRLVVLPCKVGAPVYRIGASICKWREIDHCDTYCSGYEYEDCWEGGKAVLEEKFSLGMLGLIGKTVFLTREDAEAAMEGESNNVD